jgi:hypothetical protein
VRDRSEIGWSRCPGPPGPTSCSRPCRGAALLPRAAARHDRERTGGGAWRGGPPPRPQAGGRGQVVVRRSGMVTRDRGSAGRSYEAPVVPSRLRVVRESARRPEAEDGRGGTPPRQPTPGFSVWPHRASERRETAHRGRERRERADARLRPRPRTRPRRQWQRRRGRAARAAPACRPRARSHRPAPTPATPRAWRPRAYPCPGTPDRR